MSSINQVYTTLRTIIPTITAFSGKKELPCPENLANNNDNILKNGWGIIVGASSPFESQELCRTMDEVNFSIVITQESFNSIASGDPQFNTNNALLSCMNDLRVRLLDSDKIGIPQYLDMISYTGSSAIEFINSDKYNIRAITVNFNFLITEALG